MVDGRLAEAEYLAGDYSIADMACFPWMRLFSRFGIEIVAFPNVGRWLEAVQKRPAVKRALKLL